MPRAREVCGCWWRRPGLGLMGSEETSTAEAIAGKAQHQRRAAHHLT